MISVQMNAHLTLRNAYTISNMQEICLCFSLTRTEDGFIQTDYKEYRILGARFREDD